MNHVEIRYSYCSQKAELKMNGEEVSPYSELTAIFNRPFLEVVTYIFKSLDNEIFDEYEIDLYATTFQYDLLMDLVEKSEYCKVIHFHKIGSLFSKETLIERLSFISNQHNITISESSAMKLFCKENINIPTNLFFTPVEVPNADIGIFNDETVIPPTIKTIVILSDSFRFQNKSGHICYYIPQNKLDLFLEYYEFEFVIRPMVAEYLTALKYIKLNDIQKTELEAIKTNKPAYYIGDIPTSMDQGDSFMVEFSSFPPQFYMLRSENPNIISCQNTRITAVNAGNCHLIITNNKNEMVTSKGIYVIGHQYAEEIRLVPRFEYLKCSERSRIDIIVTPYNAEDANKLTWTISDPNIIQVDENGNIIALKDGKTTITVSGRNVKSTLSVEVKPALQRLRFSQQFVQMKNGEIIVLNCDVFPLDAPTENLVWEIDNKTIASINPSQDGRRCQLIASTNYEGKGNIRCYDSTSKLGAICNIEVISKVKQGTAGKIALTCWIIGIFMPFLLPISAIASFYGLANDAEPEHRTRYIVCAVGSIIILLFWILAGIG